MDFCQKVMSLLLNTLYRLVIAFLPRNKRLVISWLQSLSTLILEPPKIKSATVSIFIPFIFHEVMGLDAMIITAKLSYQTVHVYTGTLLVLNVPLPLMNPCYLRVPNGIPFCGLFFDWGEIEHLFKCFWLLIFFCLTVAHVCNSFLFGSLFFGLTYKNIFNIKFSGPVIYSMNIPSLHFSLFIVGS